MCCITTIVLCTTSGNVCTDNLYICLLDVNQHSLYYLFVVFSVRKQMINVPSFIVQLEDQKHIDFAMTSPFAGGPPGKTKKMKMKQAARRMQDGGGDDDDE